MFVLLKYECVRVTVWLCQSNSPWQVTGFLHSFTSGGREETRGEETYKLLTGIYELIVSDCKHNNNLPVSACLLIEAGTETDRKNGKGVGDGEKMRQQNELAKKAQEQGSKKEDVDEDSE